MASSFQLPSLHGPVLYKSSFLGQATFTQKCSFAIPKQTSIVHVSPKAKFNLYELLGGRGLCNGEEGLQEELKKSVSQEAPSTTTKNQENQGVSTVDEKIPEDGFEKELLGLTGGFPGGEKGLQKFIQENPPPKQSQAEGSASSIQSLVKKPKPPELPMLLPGMIVIVKNPNNPFHMYCGIVQRITDGKAGVLFEGGNWDRLVTFRLEELERREKGPPMVNPKSAILETMLEESS